MSDADFPTSRRTALGLVAGTAVLPLLPITNASAAPVVVPAESRRDIPFDDGWRFQLGEGSGLEAAAFDDSGWRAVHLPHDWSVEDIPGKDTPFDPSAIGGTATGFTTGGEGWYRKRFRLEGVAPEARVELAFDGIYERSDVWLNGARVGGSVSGYTPFALDLTPQLNRSGDNVIAVRARNIGKNSRWYGGSGIYREVRLDVLPGGTRFARWGVGAWTRRIAAGAAEVDVTTRILDVEPSRKLVTRLRDAQGVVVAETSSAAAPEVRQVLKVRAPHLWSPVSPYLYTLESELCRGDEVVDRVVQRYGVRIVIFDPHQGMTINGVVTKLHGGCIHHDNGLLGARAFRDADERRIRLLQARGFNAIRSSHNQASRSLRETCDRLGMLLIEEAFDAWHVSKNPDDFSTRFQDHWQAVLEPLVLSARNSPSVIMWSIGNEIPARTSAAGLEWSYKLANAVHALDPTRPVTAAIHGTTGRTLIPSAATARPGRAGKVDNASVVFLDVPGYNYRLGDIEEEEQRHPERVVYASETFPKDVFEYKRLMDRAPYFIGEFVWTAMDYIGEAGIGVAVRTTLGPPPVEEATSPYTVANCGDLDLIGGQKPPSLARDIAWGLSKLEVLVHRPLPEGMGEITSPWGWPDELPSWTWQGAEGKPLAVRIYTHADHVEVLLNGIKVAEKRTTGADMMQAEIKVPYRPGRLEVVARQGGRVIARKRLETVGPAAQLRLRSERTAPGLALGQLGFVHVEIADAEGRTLPDELRDIRVSVQGPAELIALGSGNPQWMGSFQAPSTKTFRGLALTIIRFTAPAGPVRIVAEAKGLPSASSLVRAG